MGHIDAMAKSDDKVRVKIPDLYVSFLAEPPRINPAYEQVKVESEKWLKEYGSLDERTGKAISKCNHAYFMAIAGPEAAPSEYRTLCDWGNWVFPFDDMFDEGKLGRDVEGAKKIMQSLQSAMLDGVENTSTLPDAEPRLPLVRVHDFIWERIKEKSSKSVQRRYYQTMADYCAGVIMQVEDSSLHKDNRTPADILTRRIWSAGVQPIYHIIEYAYGLDIPDHVFEHPAIQEIELLGSEFVAIINDIMSYHKEEAEEDLPHNIVAAFRMCGLTAQEAFDCSGVLVNTRCQRWEDAVESLPSWGADIDRNVDIYIRGVADVVRANLNWSFKTERYFGNNGDVLRKTRQLYVLRSPTYLKGSL